MAMGMRVDLSRSLDKGSIWSAKPDWLDESVQGVGTWPTIKSGPTLSHCTPVKSENFLRSCNQSHVTSQSGITARTFRRKGLRSRDEFVTRRQGLEFDGGMAQTVLTRSKMG